MKKILFWIDYNVISHIANWCGKRDEFIKYMYDMYPDHFRTQTEKEMKKEEKEEKGLVCPSCRGNEWYEGPEGGCSINIECAKCGDRFNYTFGFNKLEPIGKR